jgi:hypothetical protein
MLAGTVVAAIGIARPAQGHAVSDRSCAPFHYVVNPDHAPPDAVADVQSAAAQIHSGSGLVFAYDGLTTERPSLQRTSSTVLIAWTDPTLFTGVEDTDSLAGLTHAEWLTSVSGRQFRQGWVYLNDAQPRPSGFGDRTSWGGVLLHELGHLAGLPHSTDPNQIMYPYFLPGPAQWGQHDLAELRLTGQHAGCHP